MPQVEHSIALETLKRCTGAATCRTRHDGLLHVATAIERVD